MPESGTTEALEGPVETKALPLTAGKKFFSTRKMTVWPAARGVLLLHEMTDRDRGHSAVLRRSDQHGRYPITLWVTLLRIDEK